MRKYLYYFVYYFLVAVEVEVSDHEHAKSATDHDGIIRGFGTPTRAFGLSKEESNPGPQAGWS